MSGHQHFACRLACRGEALMLARYDKAMVSPIPSGQDSIHRMI
ncbi:MAG TPA: hypothetical protein VKB84_26205 [Candidatus Binataceae bacterium]|jgi:hypothetical protein|nr:hypothetical protein [Candidatus Binataceae bacterium]